MHQTRENIDILFRRTMPETVLENIRKYGCFSSAHMLKADALAYPEETFDHYAMLNLPEYSPSEVEMRYKELQKNIDDKGNGMIFSLLYSYADQVLVINGNGISCRIEEILNWNSITQRLGQDMFTTVWLAWKDSQKNTTSGMRYRFTWPAILKADDKRLNMILQKGLAENHFHLHGSTQSFALSWACLMNHPGYIKRFVLTGKHFTENLNFNVSRGTLDNVMEWDKRILYAALIRALLFERCMELRTSEKVWEEFHYFDIFPESQQVKNITETLRFNYGAKWKQMNHRTKCLDYACCDEMYAVDDEHHNRLLAGERNFLYHCFLKQFRGEFTLQESSLLYLYLLIKSNFRSELIQVNKRTGFQNFSDYQDRKNQFFECFDEYWTESQRLSVVAGIADNHLISLEARIMPKKTAALMKKEIANLDARVSMAVCSKKQLPYYYVIHFAKQKFRMDESEDKELFHPRNYKERRKARIGAKALAEYLKKCEGGGQRVYGIDACSLEIGCRPETFATEFRYLRGCAKESMEAQWENKAKLIELGITHHAGEDFLDIVDGIRAIDESLRFMGMEKGDRIGHALALGIEPEQYYIAKRGYIFLPKQDYLDNLVWLLFRSLEFNVVIQKNERAEMKEKARELLCEIYPDAEYDYDILDTYYDSWKLRGDHPYAYIDGKYDDSCQFGGSLYRKYMVSDAKLDKYRKNCKVAAMYHRYHFDYESKKKGLEVQSVKIEKWYVELVQSMQKAMRFDICKKGIAIECNPTSNVLIGTFGNYDQHPILTFNSNYLDRNNVGVPNMSVSINTDDLGVFDTSLENEYALMFQAIIRQRHAQGNYDDDAVYEYLDFIRENGIRMAFCEIGVGI